MREIIIIGVGRYTAEIIDAVALAGDRVSALYDDDSSLWGSTILSVPVKGPIQRASQGLPAVIACDEPHRRRALAAAVGCEWVVVRHPAAIVDPDVDFGPGSIVLAGAVVQTGSRVGAHVLAAPKTTIAHDCLVERFSTICQGVQLAGYVRVGEAVCLEPGALVIPAVKVGAGSYVTPGSVVINDLPENSRVTGVPARQIGALTSSEPVLEFERVPLL